MSRKMKMDKNDRRIAIQNLLRQNPCLTDGDLAEKFSVSAATIRLDRQILGIPQMRDRVEHLVAGHGNDPQGGIRILDLEVGVKAVGLFQTNEDMANGAGMVSAEKLYGASASFAESLAGVSFASTQVGNIKYKVPVTPGTALVMKGRIVLVRGNKKHIYISFFAGEEEVFRAKFIMEILK
ncbi:MAG TPA: transcription factor [Dialister sp.]|nr:transcription factor [Dialister sp.]